MVTLIFPAQGNPVAMKRTLDSFSGVVDEIIIGDVMVFQSDRDIVESYKSEYNIRLIKLPFNFIFYSGFANTLNFLASHAKNKFVIYMNVGEVISVGKENILSQINDDYNYYFVTHPVEKHRWGRLYNKNEMYFDGFIHEELQGVHKPYHKSLFVFEDTEKDSHDQLKSKTNNFIKELCYFRNYQMLIDFPQRKGITNDWWVGFARDNYKSMQERMEAMGGRYKAFLTGDYEMLMNDIYTSPDFEKERFESSALVEFQGSNKSL